MMRRARREEPSDEALERTLDQLEDAVLAGQPERVEALTRTLWSGKKRLPDVLANRLIAGRARVPALALELLSGFAGERLESLLTRIAEDESAHDFVRFSARRRVPWPEPGEGKARMAFLATMDDPTSTLMEALAEATEGQPFPPDGEALSEVLKFLVAMPADQAIEVATLAAKEFGRDVAWLFRGLLHVKDRSLRAAALQQIVAVGDRGATGALDRAATTSRTARLRSEIEVAKRRLQLRPVGGEPEEVAAMPPLHSAYLSLVDGDGGQAAILLRQKGPGSCTLAQLFLNEEWGVKDGWGINLIPFEQLEGLYEVSKGGRLASFGPAGESIELVGVDPAAIRGALARAVEVNAATSHPIPPALEVWEPLFHDQDPPAAEEPVVVPELDDAGFADRDDLYRKCGRLYQHRFFEHWFFNPEEILPALADVAAPTNRQITDRQFDPLIQRLATEPVRRRIRARLRRQAWLLDRLGESEKRDLALAAAARLDPAPGSEPARHPFLREMILRSLDNAFGLKFVAAKG